MKILFRITVLSILFLSSCVQSDDSLNDEFTIYQDGDITIDLIDINDARCPTNVDCVSPGNAEVAMRISKGSETIDFTLNTEESNDETINSPTSTTFFDLNIQLLDVLPQPEEGSVFNLEEYTVTIRVD